MPRNKLIANAFFYAGLIEAWGRGFEIITNEFTKEGLAVPTFKEEFGGVTATIKREIFQAIQLGKPRSDGPDDPVNEPVNEPVSELVELTERQRIIIRAISIEAQSDEPVNDPVTVPILAQKVGVSISTIKRELGFLVANGWIKHFGSDKSGRWMVIKNKNKNL